MGIIRQLYLTSKYKIVDRECTSGFVSYLDDIKNKIKNNSYIPFPH